MKRVLLLCLVLGCRKERADVKSDPAATAPKRVTCTIPEEDPIVTKVEVPARCDLSVQKARHIGQGGVLSIAQGAKLSFAKGAGLLVEGGALVARGTEEEPVVFGSMSQQPQPGDWIGLRFSYLQKTPLLADAAGGAESSLEHFVVEWAGEKTEDVGYAIHVGARDSTTLRLSHGHIRKSAATGLCVTPSSVFSAAEDLVFSDNGGFSFDGSPNDLASIAAGKFDGAIRLFGNLDHPYVLPPAGGYQFGRVWISSPKAPASLTIPEGSVVKFEKNGALSVGSFDSAPGTVSLVAKKVTFTSASSSPAAGDWDSIQICDGCSATIEDAIVAYAGRTSGTTVRGAIELPLDTKAISVVRTTFKNLAGPAFSAGSCKQWNDPKNANVYAGGKPCEEHTSPMSLLAALAGSGGISAAFGPASEVSGTIGLIDPSPGGFGSNAPPSFGGPGGTTVSKPPPPNKVRDVSVTTKGALPNEVVRRILRSRIGSLRACYGTSTVPGTLAVQIDIDGKGNVNKVTKTGGTLTDTTIVSCVTSSLSALSFPQPESGTVTAQATWDFSPP